MLALGCVYSTLSERSVCDTHHSRAGIHPLSCLIYPEPVNRCLFGCLLLQTNEMAALAGYARWRLLLYVHLDPFRSICAWFVLGWSFWVTEWMQMISVIFHVLFFMLDSHYCRAPVIPSVELHSKSLGSNLCYIIFLFSGGLKDFQASLNIHYHTVTYTGVLLLFAGLLHYRDFDIEMSFVL